MKLLILTTLFGLLAFQTPAFAQGCPAGTYPWSGNGVFTCLPDPSYNQQQQPQSTPSTLLGKWESRWGAIATDESNGVVGSSTGMLKEQQAKDAAIADCKTKGGATCKFAVSYANGCGAMVVGDKRFNVDRAATEQEAIKLSMKACSAEDTNCHVYFSSCSQAVLVR
ncbi:protein of unknown function [Dyella sp. OK004]|uniref:DUF4189 domain-containing protein n=1 Tax=Dyella sp. OK004 TaxID=1855292 RepID=UPI0008E86689|nr:DUF4189 domain-containing protein [Dyella sp. OK004]SFR90128.1 protein of unknown function [Dyella sp. OK004]